MSAQEELYKRFQYQNEYFGIDKAVNRVDPLVSVSVTTYQHRSYIKDCLDGILMQQTDFPFEVIVGEDGSNDGTREICIDYADRYQNRIRLFLRDRELSQYFENGRLVCRFNGHWNRMSCRGKYIAFCEGDDYWTHPNKLQKQIALLENDTDCSFVFHNTVDTYQDQTSRIRYDDSQKAKIYTDDLLEICYPRTCSLVCRDVVKSVPANLIHLLFDWPLNLYLSTVGYGAYVNDCMATYRIHDSGMWSQSDTIDRLLFGDKFYTFALLLLDESYKEAVYSKHKLVLWSLLKQGLIKRRKDIVYHALKKITQLPLSAIFYPIERLLRK